MIIDSLSMLDFRVFSGVHHFDLTPRKKYNKPAPIVLFGGLNGGGKTSTLAALKLALYGKGVRGASASVADYHQYLRECIHRSPRGVVQPSRAAVELTFRYAQHGVVSQYHVKRDWWIEKNDKIKEGLLITRDGSEISELSYDQAQSFLNELIPIGVSELFFFDGEKISSLAEEASGDTLRDSINKLLGLDIVERLDSDLAVLVRARAAKSSSAERQELISGAEAEFESLKSSLTEGKDKLVQQNIELGEVERNVAHLESQISSRGGAWSASRQDESSRLEELLVRRKMLEDQLREAASGLLPLAIPTKLLDRVMVQLEEERGARIARTMASFVTEQEASFLKEMKIALDLGKPYEDQVRAVYRATFAKVLKAGDTAKTPVHDLSDSRVAAVEDRLIRAIKADTKRTRELRIELDGVDAAIDSLGDNIARAPDEAVLVPMFAELAAHRERLGALKAQKSRHADDLRDLANKLTQVARRLDQMHEEMAKMSEKDRIFATANQTRDALKQFSLRARECKLKELERQFFTSFNQLARKVDRHLSIRIDPATFEVVLLDDSGAALRKEELSAGEKQIYAIAILESLARTSGRSLPVIIDTPLGRLDSVHRRKLVENYFPKTSHQVLILSTDTEIDHSFYDDLQPSISHAYHLSYDEATKSSSAEEGYFWRMKETA